MISKPAFLQASTALGLRCGQTRAAARGSDLTVPRASHQPLYFRGGNSTDELIHRGAGARRGADALLPDRARASTHVALAVVRGHRGRHNPGAAARGPGGLTGTVVVDLVWWRS